MSETTTIAFVGCAHIHTPGFVGAVNKRENIRVKYVYDKDTVRSEKRASELAGSKVETDFNKIVEDPEVSAVIICSETDQHEELVLPLAKAKKNLFVEKPLGFRADDAYKMAAAIEEAGVIFHTGYFTRGDAKMVFLKRQVEAGAFGKITRVRGSNCHSGALGGWFDSRPDAPADDWRWMADPKVSGCGGFGDLGTHYLDILLWLMGEAETVTAQIDNGTSRYEDCEETGEGLLRFKNGVIGTLAAGWDDVANPTNLQIAGTEGHAIIVNGKLYFQSKHVEGADGKEPYTDLPPSVPAGIEAYLNAITGQRDALLVGAREAAYRSAVMEALYAGAREGTWVTPRTS
jgi:predicted dehydrogenase